MPIDQVANVLLGPNGEPMVDLREKDVTVSQDPMERVTFARLHTYAQRYGLSLVCRRCDHAVTGQNNDSPSNKGVLSMACRCREWKFVS